MNQGNYTLLLAIALIASIPSVVIGMQGNTNPEPVIQASEKLEKAVQNVFTLQAKLQEEITKIRKITNPAAKKGDAAAALLDERLMWLWHLNNSNPTLNIMEGYLSLVPRELINLNEEATLKGYYEHRNKE